MRTLVLWMCCFFIHAEAAEAMIVRDNGSSIVQNFIDAVKSNNAETIAKYVVYPLSRVAPVPDIHDEKEFIERYAMLFDDNLRTAIIDSNLDDWENVGWRGIMLYSGLLWLNDDGKLIALNSMSPEEQKYSTSLAEKDKNSLYSTLKNYNSNIYIFDIAKGRGRIDEISDKKIDKYHEKYRYAFWNKGKSMSDKPDIVINDGKVEYYGSANNTGYIFKNGEYTYHFDITYVGSVDTPPYELSVHKNEQLISSYPAEVVK